MLPNQFSPTPSPPSLLYTERTSNPWKWPAGIANKINLSRGHFFYLKKTSNAINILINDLPKFSTINELNKLSAAKFDS